LLVPFRQLLLSRQAGLSRQEKLPRQAVLSRQELSSRLPHLHHEGPTSASTSLRVSGKRNDRHRAAELHWRVERHARSTMQKTKTGGVVDGIAFCLLSACETERARSTEVIELAKHEVTSFRTPRLSESFDSRGRISTQTEWETEYLSNEESIRRQLQKSKGDITIKGWTTKRISPQVYLAIYEVSVDGDERLWVFEVNLQGRIVRNVAADPALGAKYGYTSQ
jgi:hypothetical protein